MLKLAMIHLAIKQVPTGRILFEIGKGGDGKSLFALLEKSLLGEENFAILDNSIFLDRSEFRRSAHFGCNKIALRFQEFTNEKNILSDLWKRMISGEEMDLRVNYGFTVKQRFDTSMKVQELNRENIPVIEKTF